MVCTKHVKTWKKRGFLMQRLDGSRQELSKGSFLKSLLEMTGNGPSRPQFTW